MENDRIVRPREAKILGGLSDQHRRRLEAAGKHPKRFKLVPDSGPGGATGWMLSTLLSWNAWRAAGGPGTWAAWCAAASEEEEGDM